MISKDKVKEQRKIKGLSQEGLSEKSGLSIRTIQRIEKGLSEGSPHTLISIAKALDLQNEDLLIQEKTTTNVVDSDLGTLKLMNLSALSILVIPLGNIIFPSIIFRKNKSNILANKSGRKILSFQILWTLITILFLFLFPVIMNLISLTFFHAPARIEVSVMIGYIFSAAINVFITVSTAIKIANYKTVLSFVPNVL